MLRIIRDFKDFDSVHRHLRGFGSGGILSERVAESYVGIEDPCYDLRERSNGWVESFARSADVATDMLLSKLSCDKGGTVD